MRVLFRGWFNIPHSYAMVNCFQLVALHKRYGDRMEIFIDEQPYFNERWNASKKLVYSEEDNKIIRNFREWRGEEVDLVYSITYPYDIQPIVICGKSIPKCIFYTSEFAWLNEGYFTYTSPVADVQTLRTVLALHPEYYYTAPSVWSHHGLRGLVPDAKNKIITHGVNPSIFFQLQDGTDGPRQKIRRFYGVADSDILLINIGSMTENKGIMLILTALHKIVHEHGYRNYKLLLKGSGDLYESQNFVEAYFTKLVSGGEMTREEVDDLLEKHIIFTNKTLSYEKINELFNAADYYLSPYLAEGFNLTVLESLSAGLPVIVPKTGSTKEFMDDIYANGGGEHYIHYINSQIGKNQYGMHQNIIEMDDLVSVLLTLNTTTGNRRYGDSEYRKLRGFISQNYSWERVAEMLYSYFEEIISGK
jgi:glycosyltransferase involved in cell wall biosynthesis